MNYVYNTYSTIGNLETIIGRYISFQLKMLSTVQLVRSKINSTNFIVDYIIIKYLHTHLLINIILLIYRFRN